MADSAFQKRLIEAGFEPVTDSGPEQTAQLIKEELVRWTPLLKTAAARSPELQFMTGDSYLRLEEPEKAIPFLRTALVLDSKLTAAHA